MKPVSRKPADAAPARLGALAKLPVFLDLAAKSAVVAGGTAAAAWKAELLAAAGADVCIYAAELSDEMAALIDRGAAAGSITHVARNWDVQSLAGAAVAFADAEDEAEAEAFWRAARAAGVPVNVIDKPAFCQFQLGSIVNRSPVVIAISTDGAAPILGQAIRRRIEVLLPPSLAAWGRLAKTLRGEVTRRLAPGAPRRAFWERLAERAFGPPPGATAEREMDAAIGEIERAGAKNRGRVTLVGAGPGDAELLTLKAVRALQSADVILYDDLVSDAVLELARREARRICVGKRGHGESCRQGDINSLMVGLAGEGRHVVRLKSGDPTIFGRAGEEMAALADAHIACEIVPGITTASAMAATLGLSLTHRDCAHSVRYVTGHGCSGELPESVDWQGLADPSTTLIVYMGGKTAPAMAERLIEAGLAAGTPVAAVAGVSRPTEWRWTGTLADLAGGRLSVPSREPVIIGIGAAFSTATAQSSAETQRTRRAQAHAMSEVAA